MYNISMHTSIFSFNSLTINPYSLFGYFITYLYLFIIGSFLGYIGEVFFRRYFSMKRWINPGFLKGPCLPLYGFGLMGLHFICEIGFKYFLSPKDSILNNLYYCPTNIITSDTMPVGSLPFWATSILVIIIIGIAMTLLEYVAGIIFIKGLRIKLWDYSKMKGNIQGIICPLFSFLWLFVGAIYWFAIRPLILRIISLMIPHMWVATFFIGLYYGILLIDFINSVKLSIKITGEASKYKRVVDFEKFKLNLRKKEVKDSKLETYIEQIKNSFAPTKEKIDKTMRKLKAQMYVNNEIPTTGNQSETPRTKIEEQENKKN